MADKRGTRAWQRDLRAWHRDPGALLKGFRTQERVLGDAGMDGRTDGRKELVPIQQDFVLSIGVIFNPGSKR